ncbi:acid-shock protein [Faecalibacterium prausnitzii]|uniref:acid-shock protein n=1 Tax=Faecalibacterium TaxID=216851 RepID=UPI0032AFC5E3
MKHKRLAAAVLAAALWLTGCGGAAAPAAPAGSGTVPQSTADTAVQTAQKDRITEQFALEKTIRDEYGITQKLTIHVPQLVCDGPDAAYLNDELAAMYAAEFRQYEDSPEIEPQQDEWCPETYINWDAYWYGDCVSLVVFRYDGGSDPGYSRGWCFDFATEKQVSVAEMLQRMGLDPDAVQQQMLRGAMQTFDRRMAQGGYYEGLRSGGNLASMRMNTLENNQLEDLCLLPEQDRLVLRGGCSSPAGSGWRQLDVEIPLQAADPQPQTVLTDTYGSASVQLEGTQGTITLRRTPETAAWDTDYGIRLEQDRTYPILGIYNEYIDLCIGELGASFHPVVYLLTKDGVVEYVDVLHCLMFGNALVCQDPIYIANQGVALERSGKEVILHQEDGSVLELAPLTAEWNMQEIPSEAVGAFNDMSDNQFDWMDVESNGSVQMGVQDNNVFYQGYADYLGVVPEGMVLGVSANETADGMPGITFVAAVKYDLYNETLSFTMIDGQNPFAEGKTQLQLIRCPDA